MGSCCLGRAAVPAPKTRGWPSYRPALPRERKLLPPGCPTSQQRSHLREETERRSQPHVCRSVPGTAPRHAVWAGPTPDPAPAARRAAARPRTPRPGPPNAAARPRAGCRGCSPRPFGTCCHFLRPRRRDGTRHDTTPPGRSPQRRSAVDRAPPGGQARGGNARPWATAPARGGSWPPF